MQDANYLRLVGMLVSGLGLLYIVSGRLNADGFVVASLLDRPLVPAIMAVLWFRHILPGSLAAAFAVSDFGGFLWTLPACRADGRRGINVGGPGFRGQSRAARSVELFGWILVGSGLVVLVAPYWTASGLRLPGLPIDGPNYFRLTGLLVGGLGMLFVVSGSLNSSGAVFATQLVRPLGIVVVAVLWWRGVLAGSLAAVHALGALGGVLWTARAWRADIRRGCDPARVSLIADGVAGFFAFVSGVLRNARTFHPDARVFRGTARSLNPPDATLARAAAQLEGSVLMRIGMGIAKKGMPPWLADHIPDLPSMVSRFFHADAAGALPLERRDGDFDLLCTAGGDRLWKLLLNSATGARMYGLDQFD